MYTGQNFNLGMVPGEGRLPATKVMEHLVKRQESFGVNYKTDTIAGTLDGCTTNIKVGKELKKLLQLCLAHGFQLGIVKTVYKPLKKKELDSNDMTASANSESDHEEEEEENDSVEEVVESDGESSDSEDEIHESGDEINESEDEDEENDAGNETGMYEEAPEDVLALNGTYGKVIQKMRKVINRYAGRSTPRSDALQAAIKEWQKQKVSQITIYQTLFGR